MHGARVLRSLFEEQIIREQMAEHFHLDGPSESAIVANPGIVFQCSMSQTRTRDGGRIVKNTVTVDVGGLLLSTLSACGVANEFGKLVDLKVINGLPSKTDVKERS